MNKEQLEQWFKAMADGFFGFVGYILKDPPAAAVAFVAGLLVLVLVFGLIAKVVGARRRRKEERMLREQHVSDAATE